jgi:monoterpene epsilon-lactone hydrolase
MSFVSDRIDPAAHALELRHLRAFVMVADELNFRRAAERLHITQPALTRQIQSLERLIGCQLLNRSTRTARLTPAGEALLNRTRPVLVEVDAAVTAARSVGGELAARMGDIWQPFISAVALGEDIEAVRTAWESVHARAAPPPETDVRAVTAGGVPALVVGETDSDPPSLLHLHGGGYLLGSAFGYRSLAGALAAAGGTTALVPDYRLAPEHPYPAALDDALAAYLWILGRGTPASRVTVTGDSSGGGLVLSLLLTLRARALPMPGSAVLLCPWLDFGLDHDGQDEHDPPSLREARRFANAYLAGHPADDPIVNPLRADLTGLPPLLVHAAAGDERRIDAQRLTKRAAEHGVEARLDIYPVDAHVFPIFWSFLPLAHDAVQAAGEFARKQRDRADADEAEV